MAQGGANVAVALATAPDRPQTFQPTSPIIKIIVENRNDPYWEEAARNLIKGLILHVITAAQFEERRNLVTVRRLGARVTQGSCSR